MSLPWLAGRLEGVPPSLRARVESAVSAEAAGGGDPGAALRRAAERLLAESKTGAASRGSAMTLLAADALMTLACEWVAEHDPDGLARL